MLEIVEEMLVLATIKQEDVDCEWLDMAKIVTEVGERLAYFTEENLAEIITPNSWPGALGKPSWVQQVWFNFMSNAVKYGGQPPQVELGATDLGNGYVRFWVRDNGKGLTPEQQTRLFTPFERLEQKSTKGHGLGLSIVRRIVEKLGGEVGVESVVGEGSTFYFTLPAARMPDLTGIQSLNGDHDK
jgi:signal transduction histidine kinase